MDGANVMSFTLSAIPKAIYSYLKKYRFRVERL